MGLHPDNDLRAGPDPETAYPQPTIQRHGRQHAPDRGAPRPRGSGRGRASLRRHAVGATNLELRRSSARSPSWRRGMGPAPRQCPTSRPAAGSCAPISTVLRAGSSGCSLSCRSAIAAMALASSFIVVAGGRERVETGRRSRRCDPTVSIFAGIVAVAFCGINSRWTDRYAVAVPIVSSRRILAVDALAARPLPVADAQLTLA